MWAWGNKPLKHEPLRVIQDLNYSKDHAHLFEYWVWVNEEARGTGGSGQERMSEIKILEAVNFWELTGLQCSWSGRRCIMRMPRKHEAEYWIHWNHTERRQVLVWRRGLYFRAWDLKKTTWKSVHEYKEEHREVPLRDPHLRGAQGFACSGRNRSANEEVGQRQTALF
jgi:hypothetical protein